MSRLARSNQRCARGPAPCTHQPKLAPRMKARSKDCIRQEIERTTCGATAHKHIRRRDARRFDFHALRADPQAGDRGLADGGGCFAAQSSWWPMALGAPQPADRVPSELLLLLLVWLPELPFQGRC